MRQDARFALRMIARRPGFSAVAILTLALGIGGSTAIFSVVHSVLLRPLPYPEGDRVVQLFETTNGGLSTISPPNLLDWKAQSRSFEAIAAFQQTSVTLSGAGDAERLPGAMADPSLFAVLRVPPARGRTFEEGDARPGAAAVAVLGHGLWMRRFGGDPGVLGRQLTLDGVAREVIGVMPAGFVFPDGVDLWLPLTLDDDDLRPSQRGAHYLQAVARLREGTDVARVQEELSAIERELATRHAAVSGYGTWVMPMLDATVGAVRRPLFVLLGAVGFVLLIACLNVSTLLLAGATARRGEMAVRRALGASRRRLVRQVLVESAVLSVAGGICGVLLAAWGVRGLAFVLPQNLPRADAIVVNAPVLLFTVVLSLTAAMLFGLVPALQSSGDARLSRFLKNTRGDTTRGGRPRVFGLLVASEMAMAVALLVGAGLAARSFLGLVATDTGFDARGSMALTVRVPDRDDTGAIVRFYRGYVESVQSHPEIVSAGGVSLAPLATGGFGGTFNIIGSTRSGNLAMLVRAATPGYFETLRIPIVRGRGFTEADQTGSERVAVISAEAARRFWPGEDPIGQRIRLHVGVGPREGERRIVGIAGDVRTGSLVVSPGPLVYVPHTQYPTPNLTVFARSVRGPQAAAVVLREQLSAADPNVAPSRMLSGDALVASAAAQPRFRAVLLGLFGSVALILAAMGLFGVTAFSVSQRRVELGLRMALGAEPRSIVGLVLRDNARPALAGLIVGLAGAAGLARMLSSLFAGISPADPATFAAAAILLAVIAAFACYLPARRATSIEPAAALKQE